jgi:hypothetical protein
MSEREIKQCLAILSNPVNEKDTGEAVNGRYFREGDWITLCDDRGSPLRSEDTGARYTHKLEAGDHELTMAKRLTLRHHRAANRDEIAGWGRRLEYPSRGWA